MEETGAAQYYRDARILPIYEGTNGIQAIDLVTRKLPLGNGEVVDIQREVDRLIDERPGRTLLHVPYDEAAVQMHPLVWRSAGPTASYLVDASGERLIVPYYDPRLRDAPPAIDSQFLSRFEHFLADTRWPEASRRAWSPRSGRSCLPGSG